MTFPENALRSAAAFRVLLDCMARPGRIGSLGDISTTVPLFDATFCLIRTLVDVRAPIYLTEPLCEPQVVEAIRFDTGATILSSPADAVFVICLPDEAERLLPYLACGTPDYPDRSTTLVIQCPALSGANGVSLSGPGIEREALLEAQGLPQGFWRKLDSTNRQLYPMGTDVFLTAPGKVAAIPRSTHVGVA